MERILIQSDWNDILEENSDESFWVQYKFSPAPAINGKLEFINSGSFTINSTRDNSFSLKSFSKERKSVEISYMHNNVQLNRKFVAHVQKFQLHFNKKNDQKVEPVLNIDVTDGGLGVSASTDGSLLIWLTDNGQIRRVLEGHISDINVCKFFPSGLVVLSGGADLRLKIWSAENGSNPVTLIGHTGAINDVCFVDRGKNVVSVGRDGQFKLFNVSESRCVATVSKYDCVINGCSIKTLSDCNLQYFEVEKATYADSYPDICNKLVACACEDGFLRINLIGSKKSQIFEFNCESAVNCCCFLSETTVACGTQAGFIFIYDLIGNTVNSWREFRSSILSINQLGNGFISTTADGSCFTWNLNAQNSVVELTGSNCDPVYKAVSNQTHVFTCCRDGYIRKYNLSSLQ